MDKAQRVLTTCGIAILIAFLGAVGTLQVAPFDTGLRGAGFGALSASALLEFLWVLSAVALAAKAWKSTGIPFRLTLLANGIVVSLLVADFVKNH